MPISRPITRRLAQIESWKRVVWVTDVPGHGRTEMVTREFHDAFVAELVERMRRREGRES